MIGIKTGSKNADKLLEKYKRGEKMFIITELEDLVETIKDNDTLTQDALTERLAKELIDLDDTNLFHLVLNYIEKVDGSYSYHVMNKRKQKNDKLIKSYNKDTGLLARDEGFLSDYMKSTEADKTDKELDKEYNEINKKYGSLSNYEMIRDIIEDYLSGHGYLTDECNERIAKYIESKWNFELVSKEIAELVNDEELKTAEELFNEFKEFYKLQKKANLEIQKLSQKQNDFLQNCPEDLRKEIWQSIKENDIDALKECLRKSTTNVIRDTLISNFYEEAPVNFIKNLLNIINFQLETGKEIIDSEMLSMYQIIITSLKEDNHDELLNLYNKMSKSNIDYKGIFFDQCRAAKNKTAEMIMHSVFKPKEYSKEQKIKEEEIDGVNCYILKGEPFYMLVHGSTKQISSFQGKSSDAVSLSLISGERLNIFNDEIIYGFTDMNPDQFVELYNDDAATDYRIGNENISELHMVPTYTSPQKFIERTPESQFNEIVYLTGREKTRKDYPQIIPPKPSYLVCLNDVNRSSIALAKKLGIPIVIIETEYYPEIIPNTMGHFSFQDNDGERYRQI